MTNHTVEFFATVWAVILILSAIALSLLIYIHYFAPAEIVTHTAADSQKNTTPVECHVYYHNNNETHEWKGITK